MVADVMVASRFRVMWCALLFQQLMSDDTLGLLDRLEAAGIVQPSEQTRVVEALALVNEDGLTAEVVAGQKALETAQKLLAPTGLTLEELHKKGLRVPTTITEELERAGMSDAEERARLVQALAHATASGVTAEAVASGQPMMPAEAQWELVPVPASWGVAPEDAASSELLPPSLPVKLQGDAVVIGRGSVTAGIHKMHRAISRRHAEVFAERGALRSLDQVHFFVWLCQRKPSILAASVWQAPFDHLLAFVSSNSLNRQWLLHVTQLQTVLLFL